ncbi:MAG: hypothetical protein KAU90_06170 [Sulfurovaceae bacterium]|nr:hypothetical protein [Sulfurovaceae bacterium]
MKKILLTLIALILIFVIYYMTIGSKQLTGEIRKEVNKDLIQLKQSGFIVDEQNLSKDKQKIVLTFQDTDKIKTYLNNEGQYTIDKTDIEILKGMQIGMDIEYMPTMSDAMAIDIYPIKLPNIFYQDIYSKDKIVVDELENMIKEKVFLVHININKLLSSFNGYAKDIDREFQENNITTHFLSKGFKFNGNIKNEKIEDIRQKLDTLSFKVDNQFNINLTGATATIKNSDKTLDNDMEYNIKSFDIFSKIEEPFNLKINNILGLSQDKLKGDLLDSESKIKIASIDFNQNGQKTILNSITIDSIIKNINEKALEKLEKLSSENMNNNSSFEQFIPILKEIIKDDISIEVPNISIAKITSNGKSFDGFKLKALAKVAKDFDLKSLNSDPLAISKLVDAKINIEASNELISIIASNPQAMVMMMILQPIDKNGKKYYDIEFSKGSLNINGKPFM